MTTAGEHAFRAGALAALVGCLAFTGTAIGENAVAGWNGSPLVLLCMAAALEAYVAYRLLRGGNVRTTLAHIAIFLIVGQLYVDALDGRAPFQGVDPYLSSATFLYAAPVFFTWLAITAVMRTLAALDLPPEQGFLDESPVRRLTVRFFVVGTALFITAGVTQPDILRALNLGHIDAGPPLLGVFAYFTIGIVFLGRLEYSALRHRWQAQHTTIAAGLANRWTLSVVLFTAGAVLLALVLPTSETLGILGPGHDAWDQLVLLLRGPLSSLLGLFHPTTPTRIDPHLKPPPGFHLPPHRPSLPHHGGGSGGSWFDLARTILFWAAALALVWYLVRSYLRRVRGRARRRRQRPTVGLRGAFSRFWAALIRRLRALVDRAAEWLPAPVAARVSRPKARRGWGGESATASGPTRQQIMAYYRRMVKQAERRGVRRTPAHTPEEFAALLDPEIPQVAGDVGMLTTAFVEARYGRRELPEERLGPVREGWRRIRQALRARRA